MAANAIEWVGGFPAPAEFFGLPELYTCPSLCRFCVHSETSLGLLGSLNSLKHFPGFGIWVNCSSFAFGLTHDRILLLGPLHVRLEDFGPALNF